MKHCSLILLYFIFFISSFTLSGQTFRVYDRISLSPLQNVHIYNESRIKDLTTDRDGQADAGIFASSDILTFEHPSYQTYQVAFTDAEKESFKIFLNTASLNFNKETSLYGKWKEPCNEIPAKIDIIQSDEIAFITPQTASGLLSMSGQVFSRSSAAGCSTPAIRGFTDDAVLTLMDGIRINNPIFRNYSEYYSLLADPFSMEQVDVLSGPGSAMWGSDAIGGVIGYRTKEVKLSTYPQNIFDGNVITRYSSANLEKAGHVDFNWAGMKFGMLTSFTYQETDDIEMGSKENEFYRRGHFVETLGINDELKKNDDPDIQKFSAYDRIRLMQKFSLKMGENTRLDYAFHYHTSSDIPIYEKLMQYSEDSLLRFAQAYYGSGSWMMNTLSLTFDGSYSLCDQGKITISQQKTDLSMYSRLFSTTSLDWHEEIQDAYALNIDMNRSLDQKNKSYYGIEALYSSLSSEGYTKNISDGTQVPHITTLPDDGSTYMSFSGYYGFKSNFDKKATFQASVRYNQVIMSSAYKDTVFYKFPFDKIEINTGTFAGNMGIIYHPDPKWQFRFNVASGYRAPSQNDFTNIYNSVPGTVILPNENLKPEGAYSFELGAAKLVRNNIRFDISGFYTYLVNYIILQDIRFNGLDSIDFNGVKSDIEGLTNNGGGWLYGMNASIDAEFLKHLSLFGKITLVDGEDRSDKPLPGLSPMYASAGLAFKAKQVHVLFYLNHNGEFSSDNFPVGQPGIPWLYALNEEGKPYSPAWTTLNFKATFFINKMVQLNAGIENIGDQRYRPYGSALAGYGRNITGSVRFIF